MVDDSAINRKLVREMLEGYGLTVDTASDGREAVDAVQSRRYALVFMDLEMPELDGYEATRVIRSDPRFSALPVIALSAHSEDEVQEKILASGMNGYISKPVHPAILRDILVRRLSLPENSAGEISESKTDHAPEYALTGELPGINIASALDRVRGNHKLLRKLLRHFCKNYADIARLVRADLEQGNTDAACRKLHTFRGVAGNIGADDLYFRASALETALKKNPGGDLAKIRQQFEDAVNIVLISLEKLREPEPAAPLETAQDIANLKPVLDELDHLLESGNIRALVYPEKIRRMLPEEFREAIDRLAESVENYDFEDARTILEKIISCSGFSGNGEK